MRGDQAINYSKLFSQLIGRNGQLDDTIASFIYYLFPRELFVRALSLIESSDMFIYVLDPHRSNKNSIRCTSVSTDVDSSSSSCAEGFNGLCGTTTNVDNKSGTASESSKTLSVDSLVKMIYENESELLHRLIIKSEHEGKPPIYVDLQNWFCSCDEFSDLFFREISSCPNDDYSSFLVKEIIDLQEFSDDRFAQLDAHSLSKQRYFLHDKVMCAHILAYSMLLRSSEQVLRYFTIAKSQVLLIPVSNMDEWLKLHINIVA